MKNAVQFVKPGWDHTYRAPGSQRQHQFSGAGPVGLHVFDGPAFHAVRAGQIRYHRRRSTAGMTGGNGMVEMGTFVAAILLGNIVGGLIIAVRRGRAALCGRGLPAAGDRAGGGTSSSGGPGDRPGAEDQLER
jgi:hypothetical protein